MVKVAIAGANSGQCMPSSLPNARLRLIAYNTEVGREVLDKLVAAQKHNILVLGRVSYPHAFNTCTTYIYRTSPIILSYQE